MQHAKSVVLVCILIAGEDTLPCMRWEGEHKVVVAGFLEDLKAPDRVVMRLFESLNIKGYFVISQAKFQKALQTFKRRKNIKKSALQQELHNTFEACNEFVEREGTSRSEDEWRQFITNCTKHLALQDVLHGTQVHACPRGQDPSVDHIMGCILKRYQATHGCR
jgi:hypothetical protein